MAHALDVVVATAAATAASRLQGLILLGALCVAIVLCTAHSVLAGNAGIVNESNLRQHCELTPEFSSRPPPRKLTNIRWLHIPKTGTSFGTTLLHYACDNLPEDNYVSAHLATGNSQYMRGAMNVFYTRKYCDFSVKLNISGHSPLMMDEKAKGAPSVVGFFRDPRKRAFSGWLVHGVRGSPLHPKALRDYIDLYGGCQMKMLLGKRCHFREGEDDSLLPVIKWRPSPDKPVTALKLLHDEELFPFFGLTDHWNESICLFHAMFGGDITKHEMQNVRPRPQRTDQQRDGWQTIDERDDPFDFLLYQVAKHIFKARLRQYGIAVPKELEKKH